MEKDVTPVHLGKELGVDPKRIREYLRSVHGTLPPHETRWHLTLDQANAARARFGK